MSQTSDVPNSTLLRIVMQNLPDATVLLFDHDLRYLLAEGQSLLRHGHDPAQMLGRTLHEVLPSEPSSRLAELYRSALAGQRVQVEHTHDGRIYVSSFVPVPDTAGNIVAGLAVVEDITERRRLEQALRERA